MAAPVILDKEEVRSILSLYHLEELEELRGPDDTAHPATRRWWVKAGGRQFDLRVTDRKTLEDMVYEKDLLVQLRRSGLPVPVLVRNLARGTFTPWARRGRYVSLFERAPGRALGVFEIRARHARSVGRLLGDLHRSTHDFRRRRPNPNCLSTVVEKVGRLERGLETRRLAKRFTGTVQLLGRELAHQEDRFLQSSLPVGAIHGGLGIAQARFFADRLVGVVDFEEACRDRLVLDLAVALSAWAWEPSAKQRGGPAGRFKLTQVRALLDGYERSRPLSTVEREALPSELRFVALRDAAALMCEHELSRTGKHRGYRDHRHHVARLQALAEGRAETLIERALNRS